MVITWLMNVTDVGFLDDDAALYVCFHLASSIYGAASGRTEKTPDGLRR